MTRSLITITVSSSEEGGETKNYHHHSHHHQHHHHHPMIVDCYAESSCIDDMCHLGDSSASTHVKLGMPAHLMAPLGTAYPEYGFGAFESSCSSSKIHPPPSRRCQRRTVTFAEKVKVKEIPLWTVAETSKVWWTLREIRQIRNDYKAIVQRIMMNGERCGAAAAAAALGEEEQFCTRGLEMRTKWGAEQRHFVKQRARQAITKAQAFQRAEGFHDPQYLAELYREYSRSCANAAHLRGMSDASAAQQS
jgi:hypothetical protein